MFLRFLSRDPDVLNSVEEASVTRLAAAKRRLILAEGDRMDTKSDAGFNACSAVLGALTTAAQALKVDAAPRSYRSNFTVNYRALFPDEARHYRVDILEASIEQYSAIWVNGDKFEFSAEAMRRAKALHKAWMMFLALLHSWYQSQSKSRAGDKPGRSDIRSSMSAVDFAWASFEHRYISELIAIEEKARGHIVQAIEHEAKLRHLEGLLEGKKEPLHSVPEYYEEQRKIVRCISHLNSVANVRRKGRDDLDAGVLHGALAALHKCDASGKAGEGTEAMAAARVLATDVVESFDALRIYLREVATCLERVDPHLCNNSGLVGRLVDWEESWEVGTRYIQNPRLLDGLCDLVAHIQQVQRLVPAFAAIFHDVDAELFMVLPRLIWLRFFAHPEQHSELVRSLLPEAVAGNEEFDAFAQRFQCTKEEIAAAVPQPRGMSTEAAAADILVKRAVLGSAVSSEPRGMAPHRKEPVSRVLEEFMRELEPWSIKLQRHCPEDWNQYSAIIVQCASRWDPATEHAPKRKAQEPFQV